MSLIYTAEGNRKYVTLSERSKFLEAIDRKPAAVRTFCRLLAYGGMRISEALSLTPQQFDFTNGVIMIECLKKRRRGVYRALPIPQELMDELDTVHCISSFQKDPLMRTERIWKWCRTTAWHHVKSGMKDAAVTGRQAMPKGLRHGFGVGVLQAGVPITLAKKWLGHARLSTTEIYTDAVGAEEQAIAARFWKTF